MKAIGLSAGIVLALIAGVLTLDWMLTLYEREQCSELQAFHAQGYPVTVPQWCAAVEQ